MVFRLNSQILENGVGPEPLHVIPILNLTMSDRVMQAISRSIGCRKRLVADEEVEILGSSLCRKMPRRAATGAQERRLIRDRGPSRARAPSATGSFCRDGCRKHE